MQNVLATCSSLWRNWLARSAVHRKVDGSNPSRDVLSFILPLQKLFKRKSDVTGQLFLPTIRYEICKESMVYITWACTGIDPLPLAPKARIIPLDQQANAVAIEQEHPGIYHSGYIISQYILASI